MPQNHPAKYPAFVKRDLDGFFGLFIDNLVQLLLIPALCGPLCGMTGDNSRFVFAYILPGAAVSILVGNVFYAWQAHRLAARTGRSDVTALPFGINTPSLLVYIFFVMGPVYAKTGSAEAAWRMGLFACLGSGLIEFFGAFVAGWIRRRTPRAALLSTLAGIAIGFISMTFALQIFHRPLVAMLPLGLILIALFSRTRFPLGFPGGLVAVAMGTLCGWLLPAHLSGVELSGARLAAEWGHRGFFLPIFCGDDVWAVFRGPPQEWLGYLSVIVPMGLFNVIGSLQNIESAEASGDGFSTFSSLAANGIGTIAAAFFGSCFPTTIYIGHPGWKALGARAGYSTLNGLVITLICLTGTVSLIGAVVPVDAGIPIVLWVGVIITAQAFQATPRQHAPAVAIGLFPAIAAWGSTVVEGAFRASGGATMQHVLTHVDKDKGWFAADSLVNGFLIHGLIVIERGYIFTCMILAAIVAFLIDRRFFRAGAWSLVAAAFAAVGLMHSFQVQGNEIDYLFNLGDLAARVGLVERQTAAPGGPLLYRGYPLALGYLLFSAAFFAFGVYAAKYPQSETAETECSGH
ncbi:MAG: NCS2 family permease [Planctomycetia bacterium]|nr:NCS2 family permease [Planctomycetia bacterium]